MYLMPLKKIKQVICMCVSKIFFQGLPKKEPMFSQLDFKANSMSLDYYDQKLYSDILLFPMSM